MELKKMYEATAFSPIASLSQNIGADDTTIYVDNVAVFPAGPGLATIGIDENAETIRYAAITDTALTGCMRGVEGTAKAWPAGENIARNFTAKDWNDLKENVEALHKEMLDKCVPGDWFMNAEDSASHIKNRTHWKEYVAPDVMYLNATVNFKSNMASVSDEGFAEIVVGKTYIVYWNGEPYECSAYTSNGEVFLGNGTLMSVEGAEHTGEPFCINLFTQTMAYVAKSTDSSETVSLKITPTGKVIWHKIDKNYLPDDYGNSSGEGGGVSSWNDLPDKPFGDTETLIAAEKTFSSLDATNYFTDLNSTMVHDGQELVVRFDGAKYTCKVKDWGDDIGLATDNYADMLAGTSELPFCLIFKSTRTNISCTSSGEHTASVYVAETVRMDGKYLPEGLPYTEGGGSMVEILPETQAVGGDDEGFALTDAITGIEVGNTYTVTYNGVAYECVAKEMQLGEDSDGNIIYGNALGETSAVGGEAGNGEPFVMVIVPADIVADMGAGAMIIPLDGATSVTIAISQGAETIHKLDNKYLDLEWLPTVETNYVEKVNIADTISSSGVKNITSLALDIAVGDICLVTYNDVAYEVTVKVGTGASDVSLTYFGNFSLLNADLTNTNEPFLYIKENSWLYCSGEANADFTISVQIPERTYNKIPTEFLPEGLPITTTFYVNLTDTNDSLSLYADSEKTVVATVGDVYNASLNGSIVISDGYVKMCPAYQKVSPSSFYFVIMTGFDNTTPTYKRITAID